MKKEYGDMLKEKNFLKKAYRDIPYPYSNLCKAKASLLKARFTIY